MFKKRVINDKRLFKLGEKMKIDYAKEISAAAFLLVLSVLAFYLLEPILMSVISGIIAAFLFIPIYNAIKKKIKSPDLSTAIVSLILIFAVIVPLWFIIPILLTQSIDIYILFQSINLREPLQNMFPALFQTDAFGNEIVTAVYSFITGITNGAMNLISDIILKFPTLFLQGLVSFFTFYFVVRDHKSFVKYIQSVLPFPKKTRDKLFKSSKDITSSVIYGQVGIGILQGIFAGFSFFIFGVGNSLFLTMVAILAGIFPVVGTTVVWVPVVIYLVVKGATLPALGVLAFGIVSVFLENAVKPVFISKRTNVHSGVILLGMVGGLFLFGILGVILGPLILSYLLIILETYRGRNPSGIFIKHPEEMEEQKIGMF